MAAQLSAMCHRWSAQCFNLMALTETLLATQSASPDDLAQIEVEARKLITASDQIGASMSVEELAQVARHGLEAAESLRAIIETVALPEGHALNDLQDELADQAEVFALSVDPQTRIDLESALDDASTGRSKPWQELRKSKTY